jgi:hypothetical protein
MKTIHQIAALKLKKGMSSKFEKDKTTKFSLVNVTPKISLVILIY